MSDAPILCKWDGEAFIPASQFWARRADQQFVVGEVYKIAEHHDRSMNSHRHYFATLNEGWRNLPDELLEEYPTVEHLRKKALIRTGYRNERNLVCSSKAEAARVAAFLKPADEYAIVTFRDAVVREWTAKSQSVKAMGNKEFQQSKDDVLGFVDDLLGVARGATAENAQRAA